MVRLHGSQSNMWVAVLLAGLTAEAIGEPVAAQTTPRPQRRTPTAGRPTPRLTARWIGQDGHDLVGPNNRLEPSDVQDLHIALAGLDPDREVTFIDITGREGEQWQYNAQSFSWKAELKREPRSRTADLFIEPGRSGQATIYRLRLRYEGGGEVELEVPGRPYDPRLRMPGAVLNVRWAGQDGHDRVGPGPAVGPDGLQDARLRLTGVSSRVAVQAIRIEGPEGAKWEHGTNPLLLPNAEFWADSSRPGEGDLFFQPTGDLKGKALRVFVRYANETLDRATVAAGRFDPSLRSPQPPLPRVLETPLSVEWLGQDGQSPGGPGDVHLRVSGLAGLKGIVGGVLTDAVRGTWVFRTDETVKLGDRPGDGSGPLRAQAGPRGSTLDLFFPPYRDERGASFALRLVDASGRMAVGWFPGQECDPGQCAAPPNSRQTTARPGDDLHRLVREFGEIRLAAGLHRLSRPLILEQPVTITSEGQATLLFSQEAGSPPWTAAIKIHAGHTTLHGFAVRFEGPIRWDQEVSYGAAVIGTTDNRDPISGSLKVNIRLTGLDLEIPEAEDPTKWIEALRLIRLTGAKSGTIAGNILRGGPIEFFDGPWMIVNNDYRGTPVGTYSHGVFTGHGTYDLRIEGNRAKPVLPEGKSWRFLVLTHRGHHDRVERNQIEQIGSLEGDTIPWSNEPEIILTEAYHVSYEGKVAALALGGRLLRIYPPQGQAVTTGDVVSLLSGPAAGQYRRVSQTIDELTYLVDPPIPEGTETVAISRGFVAESFVGNRIDIRGGTRSDGLVLAGNHFGTQVVGNHIAGGRLAVRFTACPTETPVIWGWSHAPCLEVVVEDNVFEDAQLGALLSVEHAPKHIKSNAGRTYMSLNLNRNLVRWSEPFLRRAGAGVETGGDPPPGIILGELPSHDPRELLVRATGNRSAVARRVRLGPTLLIRAAEYNGSIARERRLELPAEPTGAGLGLQERASGTKPGVPIR